MGDTSREQWDSGELVDFFFCFSPRITSSSLKNSWCQHAGNARWLEVCMCEKRAPDKTRILKRKHTIDGNMVKSTEALSKYEVLVLEKTESAWSWIQREMWNTRSASAGTLVAKGREGKRWACCWIWWLAWSQRTGKDQGTWCCLRLSLYW